MNKVFTAVVTASMIAGPAAASSYDEILTFANVDTTQFLAFDGFDGRGTLTSVMFTLEAILELDEGSVTGTTESYTNGSGEVVNELGGSITGEIRVTDSPTRVNLIGFSDGANYDCETDTLGDTCTSNYDGFGGNAFFGAVNVDDMETETDVSSYLNSFLLEVSVSTELLQALGSVTSGPTSMWTSTGSVKVTYKFEEDVAPVPLAGALPFALGGLAMLGGLSRRRKRKSV